MTPLPNLVADVHLGKLARMLRMLGFDTLYSNDCSATDLLAKAIAGNRVLLSKNAALFANAEAKGLIITGNESYEQLLQVLQYFHIQYSSSFAPFSRCMVCNGSLLTVSKEAVVDALPLHTKLYYDQFWQCEHCGRVYWKGPHYERMQRVIDKLKLKLESKEAS